METPKKRYTDTNAIENGNKNPFKNIVDAIKFLFKRK